MELATNLFTKGLLMDTNPMILGNDTLTDCLNGTLITMNGNEVILQNDMGNRRVDNAFLPPGYEPVGIKEYGGIIYVAAYNPITNKSLIGSFPSPEKRLSKEDDPNLSGEFDFDKFFDDNNVYTDLDLGFISDGTYCGIKVIKTDSFMIPLTKDTSLRAGDKFVVYGNLSSLKSLITNYENTCFAVKHIVNDLQAILISDTPETLTASYFSSDNKIDKPTDVEIVINRSVDYNTPGNEIVITKKVISPKNRKYTLQLGILNSQNEFVDITKTLVRWKSSNNDSNIVEYNDNVSELYKFNDGYFIPDSFTNPGLGVGISDAQLIRNRLTITANTYSYKLIGPLYLKINLNHIVRFNYNIYGIFTDYVSVDETCPGDLGNRGTPVIEPINNISKEDCPADEPIYLGYSKVFLGGLLVRKLRLWVEGYITYNCPDNDNSVSNSIINSRILLDELESNDENYATYEELDTRFNLGTTVYDFFDFMHGVRVVRPLSIINKLDPTSTKRTKAVYNPDTNLYTIKVTKEYLIDNVSTDDTYDYIIGVLTSFDEDNIYLRDLSCKGSLNLSLLGSGNVDITGWRFYNDVELRVTLLTVAFEAYPELNTRFENLNFNFKDITRLGELDYEGINYGGLPLYNGRQTYTIDWGDDFEPRKVYAVKITYDVVDEDGNVSHRTLNDYWSELDLSTGKYIYHNIYRWLLTTELFNEFYQSTSGISDFCDLREVDLEIATAFENKMHVNLHGEGNIVDKTKYSEKFEGGLVSKTSNISYICNHLYDVNLIANPEIAIINEELYPDFIKVDETKKDKIEFDEVIIKSIGNIEIDPENLSSASSIINDAFKSLLLSIRGSDLDIVSQTQFDSESESLINGNEILMDNTLKVISGPITYKDIYKGYNTSIVQELYNVFDKLSNIINEALPPDGYFCGVVVLADDNGNPNHFVRVGRFSTSQTATLSGDAGIDCDYVNIKTDHNTVDKGVFYSFSSLAAKIYLEFNNSLSSPGQMFLYLFTNSTGDNVYHVQPNNGGNPGTSGWTETNDIKTMLWWRTAENEWATFKEPLNVKNTSAVGGEDLVKGFIKNQIDKDYIYRMYDVYVNNGLLSIYAADLDYIYYDRYNIPLTLLINYVLESTQGGEILVLEGTDILWGNLLFIQNFENIESDEITFNLKSSDIFHDTINTFDKDHISNIDLSSGLQVDSLGQKLNPDSLYYCEVYLLDESLRGPIKFDHYNLQGENSGDVQFSLSYTNIDVTNETKTIGNIYYYFTNVPPHTPFTYSYYSANYSGSETTYTTVELVIPINIEKDLIKVTNPYFAVDSHNTINGKNTLVYNKYSFGKPTYCYQGAHVNVSGDDDRTILHYNSVNIISDKHS